MKFTCCFVAEEMGLSLVRLVALRALEHYEVAALKSSI
jgi:hypothetical protein